MSDKSEVRAELMKKRDAIPTEVRRAKDRLIRESLLSLEEIKGAKLIFFFASFRSEVDTIGPMKSLLAEGKRVVLPKVDRENHTLLLYEVKSIEELVPGYMGIPEPSVLSEERTITVNDIEAVVIPGAGFDEAGNRIGYGGGYYDRLLASSGKNIPVIAPAYEEQIVCAIPSEPHDIKTSMIVTDRRVIRCTG
ncbi:MAG: 5-formyltetrahydrofolate cyclo-ligase [Nitrospiraceae bacterium]|nr:5-formyltetrahydrofolate cyclo-ligase [Nitrospiraceae bacterium]